MTYYTAPYHYFANVVALFSRLYSFGNYKVYIYRSQRNKTKIIKCLGVLLIEYILLQ